MDRPQCCIDRCLTKTKTIKVKDIIYYLYPTDDSWAQKWEIAIKKYDPTYKRREKDIVCSLHFAKSSMQPVSRQLVDHSLPIFFPQKIALPPITNNTEPKPLYKNTNPVSNTKTSSTSTCCIYGCSTDFEKSNPKIQGFTFPENADKRKLWMFMIKLYNSEILDWNESMKVCALHFKRDECEGDVLKNGAKPSIFKHGTEARRKEILQQQSTNQQVSPVKIQSINVPLHKKNVENHSMSRRSAPIAGRRLSLPYGQMPQLTPKPILKRSNEIQSNNQSVARKITRLSVPNGTDTVRLNASNVTEATASKLTTISKLPTVSNARPIPALNKVYAVVNTRNPTANLQLQKAMVVNKSTPLLTVNKIHITKTISTDNSTAKLITMPKQGISHITRLPPQLKPAPRPIPVETKVSVAKSVYVDNNIPTISRVHSIVSTANVKVSSTPVATKPQEKTATDLSNQNVESEQDVIIIDDEDAEMAKALKSSSEIEANSEASTSSAIVTNSMINVNGAQMHQYHVKDASAFDYPLKLLERIKLKQQQNKQLSISMNKWKKLAMKMNQEYRLQVATVSSETIEIS